MVETRQIEPRGQPTEMRLMVMETQVEPKSRRDRQHRMSWRPRWRRGDERVLGCRRTKAVYPRTEVEPGGRQSPMEPKGWKDELQMKARKFMVMSDNN